MNTTGIVYALRDPVNKEVRYVGQTAVKDKRQRFRSHICASRKIENNLYVHRWIRKLLSDSLLPDFYILEDNIIIENLTDREKYWLVYYRNLGAKLTNYQIEFLDIPFRGFHLSDETKKKISLAKKGKKSPKLGTHISQEAKDKLSKINKGIHIKDLTNQKFGKLTAIKYDHSNNYKIAHWLCKCECGKEKIIAGTSLTRGRTKSCGCLQIESTKRKRLNENSIQPTN